MLQMFQLHANVEKSNRSIAEKVKLNKRMAWMSKKTITRVKQELIITCGKEQKTLLIKSIIC